MHPREDDIHAYIENALDASARADVERHLQDCADCKQLVADLAEIRQVASSLDLREPPARVCASNGQSSWSGAQSAVVFRVPPARRCPGPRGMPGWRQRPSSSSQQPLGFVMA